MLVIGFIFSLAAWAGPGDSGGGGSVVRCTPDSPWVLLDRANGNPQLLKKAATPAPSSDPPFTGDLESLDIKSTPAYARAQEILDRWKSNSPELVQMIREAMVHAPYFRTSAQFTILPQFTLNPELIRMCPKLEQKTAIHYLPKFGSVISDPVWRDTDLDTQAGLLIHEALRQIQMAYLYATQNGDLESIVAQLIDGNPAKLPGPQDHPGITGRLRRLLDAYKSKRLLTDRQGVTCHNEDNPCPPPLSQYDEASLLLMQMALSLNQDIDSAISSNQAERSTINPKAAWQYLLDQKLIQPVSPPNRGPSLRRSGHP